MKILQKNTKDRVQKKALCYSINLYKKYIHVKYEGNSKDLIVHCSCWYPLLPRGPYSPVQGNKTALNVNMGGQAGLGLSPTTRVTRDPSLWSSLKSGPLEITFPCQQRGVKEH